MAQWIAVFAEDFDTLTGTEAVDLLSHDHCELRMAAEQPPYIVIRSSNLRVGRWWNFGVPVVAFTLGDEGGLHRLRRFLIETKPVRGSGAIDVDALSEDQWATLRALAQIARETSGRGDDDE